MNRGGLDMAPRTPQRTRTSCGLGCPDSSVQRYVYEVEPHFGRIPSALCHRAELAQQLRQWFATLPGQIQIAADYHGDFELLLEVLAHKLPDNVDHAVFDLSPLLEDTTFNKAACAYHDEPDHPWHHALHDARANRAGWVAWVAARTDD